jgi:predicted transcriptional regulator
MMEPTAMNAITIKIPPSLAETLLRTAREMGISSEDVASSWLEDRAAEHDYCAATPLSPHEIEGIEQGLADFAAGRVHSHEDVLADVARWRSE